MKISSWIGLVGVCLSVGAGCSSNKSDPSSGGAVTFKLTSSDISSSGSARIAAQAKAAKRRGSTSASFTAAQGSVITVDSDQCTTLNSVEFCQCRVDNQAHSSALISEYGYCAKPASVGGGISSVSVFKIASIPARILGGGMELSTNQTGALDVTSFDLTQLGELTGEDNLEDVTTATQWTSAQVYFSHIDVKMPPVTANSGTKYYTHRYVFYQQPLTDETVIQSCGIDAPGLANMTANSNFLSGLTFKRNDILVCERTDSTACADSEFKFVNKTAHTLVSSRPGTEGDVYKTAITPDSALDCGVDSSGIPDMNVGGMYLLAQLADPLPLSATRGEGGTKTYSYTDTTGATKTGSELTVTLDVDLANTVFIKEGNYTYGATPTFTGLSTVLDAAGTAGTLPEKLHFIPVHLRDSLAAVYDAGTDWTDKDSGLTATATVSVE